MTVSLVIEHTNTVAEGPDNVGIYTLLMLFHGWLYTTMTPAKEKQMIERCLGMKLLGLAPAFGVFIGITELFAAVGLILPGITPILPWLTPLAATGLVIVMVGSVISHQRHGETKHMRSSGITLLIVLFVALIC